MRFSPWKPFYLWNTPRVSSPRYFFERRRTSRRSKSHRSFGTTTLKYRSFGISFPDTNFVPREKALNSKVCFQGRAARMRISRIHGQSLLGIPTCVKQASLLPPREWTSARSKPYFPIRCSLAQCLRAMQSSQPHEYVIRACAIESKPIGHSSHLPSRVFRSRYRNCFGTKFLKYSII